MSVRAVTLLELSFLGSPEVRLNGRLVGLSTRKTLALLVYLVSEPGLHPREKLAALFWPDHDESAGRTALRKALGLLNGALGVSQPAFLLVSKNALGFNRLSGHHADSVDLEMAAKLLRGSDMSMALTGDGLRVRLEGLAERVRNEFLAGFSLPDSLEFEDWLEVRREGVRRDVDTVLHRLLRLQVEANRFEAALATARRRVQFDAMNEAAHRAVIELHLETGDRSAALEAYNACQTVLERELGILPAPETLALVERARTGASQATASQATVNQATASQASTSLSDTSPVQTETVAVQGKPFARAAASVFVGRERECSMLEDAWQNNLVAFIRGEPGSGKTRLALEFLGSHGPFVLFENRPGDAGVPYASLARHLRALLKSQSAQPRAIMLEPWVQSELSRILPELGHFSNPIQSEQGKLRFYQAIGEGFQAVIRANPNLTMLLYDDVQFMDASSSEATQFVLEQLELEVRANLRIIYGYRKGELGATLQARINQSLLSGEGVLVELESLNADALGEFLEHFTTTHFTTTHSATTHSATTHSATTALDPNDLTRFAEYLQRYTGGNPLFVLETLKELTATKGDVVFSAKSFEALRLANQLPRSIKVEQVIVRRLERLSKPAKDLVRVAAVMGQEFTLERAANLLQASPLGLSDAGEELEATGFVHNNRFVHDLLFETTLEDIPKSAKLLLHSRVLTLLAGQPQQVSSAVLARHAVGANDPVAVFKYSLAAALEVRKAFLYQESAEHLERARAVLKAHLLNLRQGQDFRPLEILRSEIFTLYFQLDWIYTFTEDFRSVHESIAEGIDLAQALADSELEAGLRIVQGTCGIFKSDTEKAWQDAGLALAVAQRTQRLDLISEAEVILAAWSAWFPVNLSLPDRFSQALLQSRKALEHARDFQQTGSAVSAYLDPGYQGSSEVLLVAILCNSALIEYKNACFLQAEAQIEEALERNAAQRMPWNPGNLYRASVYIKLALGKLEVAQEHAWKAVKDASEHWARPTYYIAYKLLWRTWLDLAEYSNVLDSTQSLVEHSVSWSEQDFLEDEGPTFLALGQVGTAKQKLLRASALFEIKHQALAASEYLQSLLCAVDVFQNDWPEASRHAQNVIALRTFPILLAPHHCDFWHLETEALVRANQADLARQDVQARAGHLAGLDRYQIPQLRAEAVLERVANRYTAAREKLTCALERAQKIGLSRAVWEIEAEIAHLLELEHEPENAVLSKTRAIKVRDALAAKIRDGTIRQTYLEFTQHQIDVPIWKR